MDLLTLRQYLTPNDKGAFKDIRKRRPTKERPVECPLCKGHGMWNLELDAYGKGDHFRASCSQCHGWGFVQPGLDATCIHEFEEVGPKEFDELKKKFSGLGEFVYGRCIHNLVCKTCGRRMVTDSSD